MMNFIYSATTILFLFVGLYGNAAFAQQADLQGNSSTTSYSGKDKSQKSSFTKPASDNDAIFSVVMGERSDDPCYLKIRFHDVASGTESSKTYDKCSGKEKSLRTITLPDEVFVTGVRVCLNSGGDKVKGIQLIGNYGACLLGGDYVYVKPAPCGSVVNVSGHDYRLCSTNQPSFVALDCGNPIKPHFERTNCQGSNKGPDSDWEKTVNCPSGKVATGMKLNTREGGGKRRMFNGIALVCHDFVEN